MRKLVNTQIIFRKSINYGFLDSLLMCREDYKGRGDCHIRLGTGTSPPCSRVDRDLTRASLVLSKVDSLLAYRCAFGA
jgi:hypothetical protein